MHIFLAGTTDTPQTTNGLLNSILRDGHVVNGLRDMGLRDMTFIRYL